MLTKPFIVNNQTKKNKNKYKINLNNNNNNKELKKIFFFFG